MTNLNSSSADVGYDAAQLADPTIRPRKVHCCDGVFQSFNRSLIVVHPEISFVMVNDASATTEPLNSTARLTNFDSCWGPILSMITLCKDDALDAGRRTGILPRPRADNSKELLALPVEESMIDSFKLACSSDGAAGTDDSRHFGSGDSAPQREAPLS